MKKLAIIVMAALLAACGSKDGAQFIGSYSADRPVQSDLVIEQNGDAFVVKETSSRRVGGPRETTSHTATYKDGTLQIQVPTGSVAASYIKDRDVLLLGNVEYKRVR